MATLRALTFRLRTRRAANAKVIEDKLEAILISRVSVQLVPEDDPVTAKVLVLPYKADGVVDRQSVMLEIPLKKPVPQNFPQGVMMRLRPYDARRLQSDHYTDVTFAEVL